MKKTYTVVHVDTGQGVEAWFPDFPGLRIPGDRLADTIFSASLVLQRHVERLSEDGSPVPEPTTPDIWAVHSRHPEALIGFADVETDRVGKEISEDEALNDEISRDAQRSGYRKEDAVEIVRRHRREKSLGGGQTAASDRAVGRGFTTTKSSRMLQHSLFQICSNPTCAIFSLLVSIHSRSAAILRKCVVFLG